MNDESVIMDTVKYSDDILATLVAIERAYKKRPTYRLQTGRAKGQKIMEIKDKPTRLVISEEFKIASDTANQRLQFLSDKGFIEIDSSRSYQTWRAFQKVFRITGKGYQLLAAYGKI